LMAAGALLKRQYTFEIAFRVAAYAEDFLMLSEQGELSLRVVKRSIGSRHRSYLPAIGVMAGLTALHERAAMRIMVTVVAIAK
jgi:hypothetical protein